MILLSVVCLTEGIDGAEGRYFEKILDLLVNADTREIVKADQMEIGFTLDEAEEYCGGVRISASMGFGAVHDGAGWGQIRMFTVDEIGQGSQRFLYIVREASPDEVAYGYKPVGV